MAENRTLRLRLIGVVAVAVAIVVAAGIAVTPRTAPVFHGTTYTEVAPAAQFSLVDHNGNAVSLDTYRGHPVLLFFGYTKCPDVCPTTLTRLTNAMKQAGGNAEDIRVLLITVDPANDTPAALRKYTGNFGPGVVGLTGDSAALAVARQGYGAYVEQAAPATAPTAAAHGEHAGHAPAPAAVAAAMKVHSGVVYGIDRRGNLQVVITEGATQEQVADDVRTLARL